MIEMKDLRETGNDQDRKNLSKMAALLRDGNTLLSESCPQCNSPLFKLKNGEIYCASCEKKVIIVKDEAEIDEIFQNNVLDSLTKILMVKLLLIQKQIDEETKIDELEKFSPILLSYLEALKILKDLKRD
ncbi:MAG: Sjogren's syndrome/scleroderma autoantigen 1 family protein [Candidatus Helarchaeota archaeon]